MLKKILLGLALLIVLGVGLLYLVGRGLLGSHEGPGDVTSTPRPDAVVDATSATLASAAKGIGVARPKQLLFGDLHVHTTFSFDAFLTSLPYTQGEGSHPPADACDFARYCSALDFWSINDHAEAITPLNWRETVESIRQCNAVAGSDADPDTVAFLGWEWTDVGDGPADHYGHKNVIVRDTDEARIPARPIAALSTYRRANDALRVSPVVGGAFALYMGHPRYHDLVRYLAERRELELCPDGVDVHDLPTSCLETAATPADLFRKLDQWGFPSMVIPHGTTWGFYTPPGSTWDKQLAGDLHDPDRQTLFEIYSGHGNSEIHRDWRALRTGADGETVCPEPVPGYLPTCWRAGEIILERCLAEGTAPDECEARAAETRRLAAQAGQQATLTVPGTRAADWLDAGQCVDCDQGSFNYRPGGSAQYVMALSNFDDPEAPRRFRFGFMSSSDNHFARPGTGYKEVHRLGFTESRARTTAARGALAGVLSPPAETPDSHPRAFHRDETRLRGFALFELERQASFFMTGGLVVAHAAGRDRDAVWEALERREVYGTSGPRILLWFDLVNPPGTSGRPLPMGSAVEMDEDPIFQVRAVGSFEQKPGCPAYVESTLGAERLAHVCKGECYNPSDRRRVITRIEVIRIRPQATPGEPVARLIDDPWRTFHCEPNADGCAVTFSDPEFARDGRDALYYVRAIESPRPAINAAGVRCSYDESGRCTQADLCADNEDACLGDHEPRAWSSPIFVDVLREGA